MFCLVENVGIHSDACILAAKLTFRGPDRAKYPCIDLAYAAGRTGGSMTAAMNAANERANEIFRQGAISVSCAFVAGYVVMALMSVNVQSAYCTVVAMSLARPGRVCFVYFVFAFPGLIPWIC